MSLLKTRSRRMAEEQARLDGKIGKKHETPATTIKGKKKDWEWFESSVGSNVLTILLIVAGAIVLYCGLYAPKGESPSLADTGSWAWSHWLSILIFSGILAVLIARIFSGGTAKTLQWLLAGMLFFLFIITPIAGWVAEVRNSGQKLSKTKVICPDASSVETHVCVLNEEWSDIKPAEGTADNGMSLCYSPQELVDYEVKGTFYRFRSKEGKVPMAYVFKKLPEGTKCPRDLL